MSRTSLDPDVSDALYAALSSIRDAKSMTTYCGKNSMFAKLQKLTDELKEILGETSMNPPIVRVPLPRVANTAFRNLR
jgi:hypothetical protein